MLAAHAAISREFIEIPASGHFGNAEDLRRLGDGDHTALHAQFQQLFVTFRFEHGLPIGHAVTTEV